MYFSLVLKTQLICMCNIYIHLATLCTSYHLFSEWSIKPIGYMDCVWEVVSMSKTSHLVQNMCTIDI